MTVPFPLRLSHFSPVEPAELTIDLALENQVYPSEDKYHAIHSFIYGLPDSLVGAPRNQKMAQSCRYCNNSGFLTHEGQLVICEYHPASFDRLIGRNFKYVQRLAHGRFSVLVLVRHIHTDAHFAVKIMKSGCSDSGIQESTCLRHLNGIDRRHTLSIIRQLDCFSFLNHVCLVLEYVDSASNQIDIPFTLDMLRLMLLRLLQALRVIHNEGLIHADIKIENILFCK